MAVYSGKQFEAYVGLGTGVQNLGSPTTTSIVTYKMRMNQVADFDFSSGVVLNELERTGQRTMRATDMYSTRAGGFYSWGFDWLVESKELLDLLLRLVSEKTTSAYTIAGNISNATYDADANTGQYASIVLANPNSSYDRYMHGAVLNDLTLSMDAGSDGGQLRASGTFYSGFQPVIGANTLSPNATAVNYQKTIFDCTTTTIGTNAVVPKSFNVKISNPASRYGYQTLNTNIGEPVGYNRGNQIVVEGSVSCKYDGTTEGEFTEWLATQTGTQSATSAILFSDTSELIISVPTAKYVGNTLDMGGEDGVFTEIPFKGTADGANSLISITVA